MIQLTLTGVVTVRVSIVGSVIWTAVVLICWICSWLREARWDFFVMMIDRSLNLFAIKRIILKFKFKTHLHIYIENS